MSNRQTKVKQRVSANKDKILKLSKGDMYLPLDTLIQDKSIYPRRNIVENKVNAYADAIKVGVVFPAIIVESKNERPTGRILDGWHRYEAHLKLNKKQIPVKLVECDTELDAVRQSYLLNVEHGLPYSSIEIKQYVKTAEELGMSIKQIADDINKPEKKVQTMIKGFGITASGNTVALKKGLGHLNQSRITKKQEALNNKWIGQSATVYARLLNQYLEAGAMKDEDITFIKLMDQLVNTWSRIRKGL